MITPIKLKAPLISIMNVPGQIVIDSVVGDDIESVVSFTDDEHSLSLGAVDSRWEPDEGMMSAGSNISPKFPQRRASIFAAPAGADLPRLPNRRGTIIRNHSGDSSTKQSTTCEKTTWCRVGRTRSPPRFPCRKLSSEGGFPVARCRDMVKELSRRNMAKQQSIQRNLMKQQSVQKMNTGSKKNQKSALAA